MTIIRAPHERKFTTLTNDVIEDDRLSFKALGLLTYILSKPDHWSVRQEQLAASHKEGVAAIRTAMNELRAAGYAELRQLRSDDGRRAAGTEWVVYETCQRRREPETTVSGVSEDRTLVSTDREQELTSTNARAPSLPLDAGPTEAERLCSLMADLIEGTGSKRPNPTNTWVEEMDRLIRLDEHSPPDIERFLRWLYTADQERAEFWRGNILSPKKLRAKWDQVRLQVEGDRKRRERPSPQRAPEPMYTGQARTIRSQDRTPGGDNGQAAGSSRPSSGEGDHRGHARPPALGARPRRDDRSN